MILGVRLGDTGEAVGVDTSLARFGEQLDPKQRGEQLDEALEIIAGLWSGEPFSFHGRHDTVEEVRFLPRPVQRPRIPIWIGGGYPNPRPTRRAGGGQPWRRRPPATPDGRHRSSPDASPAEIWSSPSVF